MKAYIISNVDLKIKDVQAPISYEINEDAASPVTSGIRFAKMPVATVGDYVYLKDRNVVVYQGIISGIEADKKTSVVNISAVPINNIFNRNILLGDPAVSIEQYIINAINDNFISSGDTLLDIQYINASALTQTVLDIAPHNDRGIYSLDTFLRYVAKRHDIFADFEINPSTLDISIKKLIPPAYTIDATVADIINLNETVSSVCTSKVLVKTPESILTYYLFDDGTYGQDPAAGSRVKGNIDTIFSENPDDAEKAAGDLFAKNQFNHLIEMEILADSKLYDVSKMHSNDKVKIKTKTGIYDSYISGRSIKSSTRTVLFKFGDVRVTLTDKLRQGG